MKPSQGREVSGLVGWGMAVIVTEFDAACKIEAREEYAFTAREAARGSEAEPTRDDAVCGAVAAQALDTVLRQRIHGAFVITLRGENPLLAFEQQRDIGAQGLAAPAFAYTGDAEHQPDASAVAAIRPGDAHAHAIAPVVLAGRPGPAGAFHVGVLPVEVEVHRATHTRAQVALATGETATSWCGLG